MTTETAIKILNGNLRGEEGSFVFKLYQDEKFSKKRFWELYDSVIALAENAKISGRDLETAYKITRVYQRVLKEMIYHFDKNDLSRLKKFPKNYNDYIERLEGAVDAYFRGVFVDDELYDLQRPDGE